MQLPDLFKSARLRALGDRSAWLLVALGVTALLVFGFPLAVTLVRWALFALAIAGLTIVLSRLYWPQVDMAELMRRVQAGELPAALVALGLMVFCGLLFVGGVLWVH